MREGVLGQVQVGEVSTAASQQSPKQLAEKQREKWAELFLALEQIKAQMQHKQTKITEPMFVGISLFNRNIIGCMTVALFNNIYIYV